MPATQLSTVTAMRLASLTVRCARLRASGRWSEDRIADADGLLKAVAWALHEDGRVDEEPALVQDALRRADLRIAALEQGRHPWTERCGRILYGFTSTIDGSTQLFGVVRPRDHDARRPARLDVVLHGSMRSDGLSELRFLAGFPDGEDDAAAPPDARLFELHPLGRVGENAYRFAGETDVFEAIEAVCRTYAVDRDRIVLRGMSLGGVGTWRLGLTHPDVFVALGPYAGPLDTVVFSHAPMDHFQRIEELAPIEQRLLHLVDPIAVVANAAMVPVVAAIGRQDPYFLSHLLGLQMAAREGVPVQSLVSPATGHVIDPPIHAEQLRRLGVAAARGRDRCPRHLRFVTWSLRHARCHWFEALRLQQHYVRAEVVAEVDAHGSVRIETLRNIHRFALAAPVLQQEGTTLTIQGMSIPVPAGPRPPALAFERCTEGWVCLGDPRHLPRTGKRQGLQGPIDDAFSGPFLCVRGTGTPWHAAIGAWTDALAERFAALWRRSYRGICPVKRDVEVTAEDARRAHLILFGDPGSNAWIARVLPSLPVHWTRQTVGFGPHRHPADTHVPRLIAPNPAAPERYVVLNSGHTFPDEAVGALSYLLYPRLGDWALTRIDPTTASAAAATTVATGCFDEAWSWVEDAAT